MSLVIQFVIKIIKRVRTQILNGYPTSAIPTRLMSSLPTFSASPRTCFLPLNVINQKGEWCSICLNSFQLSPVSSVIISNTIILLVFFLLVLMVLLLLPSQSWYLHQSPHKSLDLFFVNFPPFLLSTASLQQNLKVISYQYFFMFLDLSRKIWVLGLRNESWKLLVCIHPLCVHFQAQNMVKKEKKYDSLLKDNSRMSYLGWQWIIYTIYLSIEIITIKHKNTIQRKDVTMLLYYHAFLDIRM